jgi:hypothetical protein
MEGVSDRTARSRLTRGRRKRSWSRSARGWPRIDGDDRGRQRSLAQRHWRRQRSHGAAARKGSPTPRLPKGRRSGSPCREEPKLDLRRQAQANRGRIAERRSGATQENCASIRGSGRESALVSRPDVPGSTCGVDTAKVVCSVVERFTGARVGSRLQKSVRSIFPELQRGEPQGKPRERGVARAFGSSPGRGRVDGSGRKGARGFRANVTGTARLSTRPQGRGSNRWKASWARPASPLTGWHRAGSWHRDRVP